MTNKPVDLDVLDSDVLEDKDTFKQPSLDKKHYGVKVKGDATPVLDSDIFAERDKYKPQTVDNKRYAVEVKEDVNAVQGVDADGDGKPKEIIGAPASGGKTYTAGNGIAISADGVISLDIAVADEEEF